VSDKPKRRWYQFSLRTLLIFMTFIGVATPAWWSHRCYCETQAARHYLESAPLMVSHKLVAAKSSRAQESLRAQKLAIEYRRAVWLPWLRPWIEDEEAP
jgi:hypothetical protein